MSRNRLTIPLISKLFNSKTLTPSQLSSFCHALATETNPSFHIFSQFTPIETILQLSSESDQRHAENKPKSMLDGVPVSVKSNIAVEGFDLTANSNILSQTPGYDCILVSKLKEAGAIIIGQTHMDEFGMGSLGTYSNISRGNHTINPYQFLKDIPLQDYVKRIQKGNPPILDLAQGDMVSPGGSSSGSAASVSMGSSIISIGTDTGGSIRLPAAWCGVVGFKPTYGAISRDGVVSYASSLDTVGVLGPSVHCVSYALDILRNEKNEGSDNDAYAWQDHVRDSTACFLGPVSGWMNDNGIDTDIEGNKDILRGLKVGIPHAFSVDECSDAVKQAWQRAIEKLEEYGAEIVTISDVISPETVKMSLPAYYVLSSAEASSNLSRYDGLRYGLSNENNVVADGMNRREGQFASTRSTGFGNEVKRRILAGTAVLSSDRFHSHYEGATNVRASMTKQFNSIFGVETNQDEIADVILIPTTLTSPTSLDPNGPPVDSTEAFQNDVMTVPVSLAGLPSISVPVLNVTNTDDKIEEDDYKHPVIGMQLLGPRLSEEKVLLSAHVLQGLSINI